MRAHHVYSIYGAHIECDLPLAGHTLPLDEESTDLAILRREDLVESALEPDAHRIAHTNAGRGYALYRLRSCHLLRFFGLVDFVFSDDLRTVHYCHVPEADVRHLATLAQGTVLAAWLGLRGQWPLHASCIERGGIAVAFAGASNMGKSTLAAVLCTRGWRLVTDDVLAWSHSTAPVRAWRGCLELRLRPDAAAGLRGQSFEEQRQTPDGRLATRPPGITSDSAPLTAICIPRIGDSYSLHRLMPRNALLQLLRYPRTAALDCPEAKAARFSQWAQLVQQVPTFDIELPRQRGELAHMAAPLERTIMTVIERPARQGASKDDT